jgi:hypothetical protein
MQPDIIGTIYNNDAEYDSEGNVTEEATAVEGFHVNFPYEVPELSDHLVAPQPATPYRMYAGGIKPVAYVFADEQAWQQFVDEHSTDDGTLILTPPKPRPPAAVTMRQARLALSAAGLLDQVDVAINALDEPQRTEARIEWDHSQEVERNRALVGLLGQALGLSDDQLDDLFREAATL